MRKIDAFAHILPPRYARRMEAIVSRADVSDRILGYQPWIHEDAALIDLDARWRAVDRFGDYRQVLTLAVPPADELGEPAVALDLARAANDELAELVGAHPDRFAGFAAALPMNDPDAATGELSRAMGELGALGAQVHTNVGGAPLDDPRFEPVFETVTRLGGAIWIHPTRSAVWADYPAESRSAYGIWWSLGWPYETSVCMARLVYSGCFDRYPGLRVITHHAGAMVPHFAGRLASPLEDPGRAAVMAALEAEPIDYFRRFFADTAMFGAAHAVRCAVEFFGTGLFALPSNPHYFALFAWGSTFGGFALVVVYLLMSVGSLRTFATSQRRVSLMMSAVIGILITGGAIFGSFYKVTSPTILAPWFALGLLVLGFASTWVLRARRPASTQLKDLSAKTAA